MAVTISSGGYVASGVQTVKGTAIAPTTFPAVRPGVNILPKMKQTTYREGGAGRDTELALRNAFNAEGGFSFLYRPINGAKYASQALGDDRLDGTAKSVATTGSGVLAAQANAGAVALVPTLASTLSLIIVNDWVRIGLAFGALTELKQITAITGTPTGGGGSSTIAVGGAAAGQKDITVVAGVNFDIGDYIIVAGGAAGAEIHLLANVVVNVLTTTTNLQNTHLAGVTVVEINAASYAVSALANTQPIATPFTEITSPYWHQATLADTLPWMTVEEDINTLVTNRYYDGKIKSIKISGTAGEPLEIAVDFFFCNAAEQASQLTPTYETTLPFIFYGADYYRDGNQLNGALTDVATTVTLDESDAFNAGDTVRIDDEEILLGTKAGETYTLCTRAQNGTTAVAHLDDSLVYLKTSGIKSFEITLDNGLITDIQTDALTFYEVMAGVRKVAVSYEQYFERDVDFKRVFYAWGTTPDPGVYYGTFRVYGTRVDGSTTYGFDIELPKIMIEKSDVNFDPDAKPLMISVAGEGMRTSSTVGVIKWKTSTADSTVYC